MEAALMCELAIDGAEKVVANDHARRSFTASAHGRVLALSGTDLTVIGRWPLPGAAPGWHATRAADGLALVSGSDHVALIEADGRSRWSFAHRPWGRDGFDSGCAWFDAHGRPSAVVPSDEYDDAVAVALDLATGRRVGSVAFTAAPAGVEPIHHPDGWVGLSVGEGQDAALTWWLRAGGDASGGHEALDVLDAEWTDWVLADVDPTGERILTTPHVEGPLTIRGFPNLSVRREIPPPDDEFWDFVACFVGDHVVARLLPSERTVAIDGDGTTRELGVGPGSIVPAADSWLTVEATRLRRWRLTP